MQAVNHFPANRPFRPFGDRTYQSTFRDGLYKGEGTNPFGRSVSVWDEERGQFETIRQKAILPPPTIIRYTNNPFVGGAGTLTGGNQIEVGKNWQTLALVNSAFNKFGLGSPPASYDKLTDDHIALAVFMNKFNNNFGNLMAVTNPDYAHSMSSDDEATVKVFAVFTGHDQFIFGGLAHKMTRFAQNYVRLESFFSENNIDAVVHEIASMINADVDKYLLRNAIVEAGNIQREQFEQQLETNFALLAEMDAKHTYEMFAPEYDITGSENFAQFKQAFTQLMQDMYTKAVNTILSGDMNQDVTNLWDGMWTNDRVFNIAGRNFTMREMDDMRTFLWSGSHRQSIDERVVITGYEQFFSYQTP